MSEKKKFQKRRPRSKSGELPQILKTKHGSAYMNYKGRRYFLGSYGSEEAEKKRRQIVAEFEAGLNISPARREPIKVAMLVLRFLNDAKRTYRKNGRSTGSYERFRTTSQPLLKLYADQPVTEFGPLALKAVRNFMIENGYRRKQKNGEPGPRLFYCRETINDRIELIVQMFRWGLANELVSAEIVTALGAVAGLRKGEEVNAREMPPVEEVEPAVVLRTLPLLSPAIAAMVRIQLMTGMRPGEVVQMRSADLYREGDKFPVGFKFLKRKLFGCWVYIPEEHKTEHHDHVRYSVLNEVCQKILEPFLKRRGHEDYLFSPAAEQELRLARMREKRKTKVQPSQECRKKTNPKRTPGLKYTVDSYRTGIQRAIERHNKRLEKAGTDPKEFIPKWFPNQLRHYFSSKVREMDDLEAARAVLGHANAKTSEIYAKSAKKAIEIALQTNVWPDQ